MKIAIAVWNDCVSTVLDFSNQILICECRKGCMERSELVQLADESFVRIPAALKSHGVDVLLCGAVSKPLERMIVGAGIRLVPFLRGPVDQVLSAYLGGSLRDSSFYLPGCPRAGCLQGGRRRQRLHGEGKRFGVKKG